MRRLGRIWTRLLDRAVPAGAMRHGLRICISFGVWLGLLESARVLWAGAKPSAAWALGLLAGIALSLLLAIAAGIALGVLLAFSTGRTASRSSTPANAGRLRCWLWQRDPEAQLLAVSQLLGALPLLALFMLVAFEATRRLVIGTAQPHFAAIAIVATHLALLASCLALYPASRSLALASTRALLRRRVFAPLLGRAGNVVVALALIAVTLCAAVAWRMRATLVYLPWPHIATVILAAGLSLSSNRIGRTRRWLRALELGVASLLLIACAASLLLVDAASETGRRGMDDTLGGSLGYEAALWAFDFDRDGYLSILGGGDCAPFDPKRGPGAVDIPNNRRDEDCDGTDLDAKQLAIEVKRDFKVPKAFPKRPSVLLVTIDAFAATRMAALGYKRRVTPRLDDFASRSTLFRYGFSQGPSTRLSFPSIFTSRFDSQIRQRLVGKHPFPIDDSEQLLAAVLSAEGYDTVAVVSDGYFRRNRWASLTRGFTELIDSPALSAGRHNSVAVTDAALRVLRRRRDRPLFLWVHYYDAHPPQVQPEDIDRFGDTRSDIYDAELRLVDREAGRLLSQATSAGDAGPLVFVTSDHGIAFDPPRHTRFNYGYDLTSMVLHVPLIVHGPMIKTQTFDELVSTMDVAPTIANLLRIQKPLRFEGASLLPELLEGKASRPQRLVHQMYLEERLYTGADPLQFISLRTEHYNLIHDRRRNDFELYAWRNDYGETTNLAHEPSYSATLRGLKQQLALFTYQLYRQDPNRTAQVGPRPPAPSVP